MGFWSQGKNKKTVSGLILLTTLLFTSGCGGSGSSGSSDSGDSVSGSDTVAISGEFEGSYAENTLFNKLLPGFLPSAYAYDPSDVSKVIVFFTNGDYVVAGVTEGSFSMDVEKGSPAGMIFVGEGNNYLGYFTLGNGIDSLPLHYDENDVESIDLGTLFASESGESMESPNDLSENKFSLSEEEQRSLRFAGGLFSAIVKNPDANGNGEIDLLEEKFFPLHLYYYYYGGDFVESHEDGLTPKVNDPDGNPDDIWNGFKFGIRGGADWPETVYFYGPEGSDVIDNPESQDPPTVFDTHTYYYSSYVDDPDNPYPPEGEYTVDYKIDGLEKTLKFKVPDQSKANEKTVLPIPTVELNNDGTINKVSWTYKAAKKDALEVDPKAIIDKVELQITGDGNQCDDYIQGENRMYNSGNLSAETQEHTIGCQYLLWETVDNITLAYDDVYGNHNVVSWQVKY